ncbi:hypothetical protein PR003_g11066 [Phytophthora rubi]|uniref:Spen paralogue and orthologue SPOC C-terminal domain-containing protein n=1 Tax=Phytophthora rubi TaxID=129364 RepID=A0A6A3MJ24_9STRA|nr:hypothetical protein PR002_g10630 [Phytophthora rubi]KAE9032629.1 hypothetical protein PR001_g10521 [Phytophthora rubi]KAE9339315.1 hypothetical protein PR003_g11066 [Phytophthora rubi]
MVAFSVYKSTKYLFDCVAAVDTARSQPYPTVDLNALEALGLSYVDVVKRIDYAEVDRLVGCCPQHPPQTIVVPATHGDIAPFQEFAKYLKARQRAGVVALADARLLILAPLTNDDSRLRCVVVKTQPIAEAPAASPANFTIDKAAHVGHLPTGPQTQVTSALPPLPEQAGEKRRHGRVRSRNRSRTQEEVAGTVPQGVSVESNQNNQATEATTPPAPAEDNLVTLYSLPRIERATRIAQLRQEYEAFNALHYDVLKAWSKSDPDS